LGIHAEELRLALINQMGGGDDGTRTALGDADPVTVVAVGVDVVIDKEIAWVHATS
jgi:hypothetical protein